jgi:hypothetical protein
MTGTAAWLQQTAMPRWRMKEVRLWEFLKGT